MTDGRTDAPKPWWVPAIPGAIRQLERVDRDLLTRRDVKHCARVGAAASHRHFLRRPTTHPAGERPDVSGTGSAATRLGPRSSRQSRRRRTSKPLGLLPAVLLVIGAVVTVDRLPAAGALQAQTSWRGLVVAPEQRCSPYDADDYPYPQSVEDRIIDELGGVYGPYTGRWFASKSDTDIEHMVARSEAHDSGLCVADPATRRRFATDLLNLTLAGPHVNRYEKVAHDAAEWLPAQNRCWFAARVIAVRQRYGLTVDRREADALDQVLAGCASTELITFARGEVPAPAPPPARAPEAVAAWDDDGNGRVSCAEARAHGIAPVTRDHPAYPFMRDGDGDGVVCESGRRRASPTRPPPSPRASGAGVRAVPQLHRVAARPSQRGPEGPLRLSAAHGPRQRRPGLRTVGGGAWWLNPAE